MYVVMAKELANELTYPVAAFTRYVDAAAWVDKAMDADPDYGYRIDVVELNPTEVKF